MAERRAGAGRTVAFILDNPQRDLHGLTLAAARLCREGVTCYLVPASLRGRELHALAPDLVVLYHFRRGFERFVRGLLEARIRVCVLDTEGGVWPDPNVYSDLQIEDRELRAGVRTYCAWGPRLAEHLVATGVYTQAQVRVTGCPRLDVYAAPTPAPTERRVLVNSNYSEANPRFETVEHALRVLRETWGWDEGHVARICGTQQEMLRETIVMTRRLAADFPDATVVLRPHPFEGVTVYREALDHVPGVRVDETGTIQQQLRKARVSIQRTSTAAVESLLAGTPALQPSWWPVELAMPVVDAISDRCDDYEAVRERVGATLEGRYAPPPGLTERIDETLAAWFSMSDGLAHRRVADAVLAQLPEVREVDDRVCRALLHGLVERHPWRRRLPRLIRRRLGLPPEYSFRRLATVAPTWWLESAQAFTDRDVAHTLASLADAGLGDGERLARVRTLPAHETARFAHRFTALSVALTAVA